MTHYLRWMLTVVIETELQQLAEDLRPLEVEFDEPEPIPLGDNEMVVGCQGPPDLPQRLAEHPHPAVIGVYPDSEMQLY